MSKLYWVIFQKLYWVIFQAILDYFLFDPDLDFRFGGTCLSISLAQIGTSSFALHIFMS